MTDDVEAYVLHARPYRETSQIVELLTREQGRIGVLSRGSRGSKRANPLQPFRHYRLQLAGRGDLRRAQAIEAMGGVRLLVGHALFSAIYLNELLVRLLYRDVPVPDVFALYAQALDGLSRADALEATLRNFEKQLLDELGYGHRYGETVAGESVRESGLYTFDADIGVCLAPPDALATQCFRGSALLAVDAGALSSVEDLRDAKRLMRAALAPHLGEKPLNSRELFRPVRSLRSGDSAE